MLLVGVAPMSWAFGVWRKDNKTVWAFGPFRLAIWFKLGGWHP